MTYDRLKGCLRRRKRPSFATLTAAFAGGFSRFSVLKWPFFVVFSAVRLAHLCRIVTYVAGSVAVMLAHLWPAYFVLMSCRRKITPLRSVILNQYVSSAGRSVCKMTQSWPQLPAVAAAKSH